MMHILYLVHDLTDPAVTRRVRMFAAGGAHVTLAGFRRGDAIAKVAGLRPIDLGITADGRFAQRIAAVSAAAFTLGTKLRGVATPDIVVGRNLEMLALAVRARGVFGGAVPIVYECLDIHRLLLKENAVGRALRASERALGQRAALLLTSSPAFLRDYFAPRGQFRGETLLLENQVLDLGDDGEGDGPASRPAYRAPIRIGWFGALRCRRSLDLLSEFTRRMDGRFQAVLRGRPAHRELPDFEARVAAEPFLSFEGPYRNPDDLSSIYGAVHFSWAIDFFEAGLNSDWLLPNRLYEGCRHGVVPIAMAGTETARFLADHGIGLVLEDASAQAMTALLSGIDAARYGRECERVAAHPRARWTTDAADCRAFVARLQSLAGRSGTPVIEEIAA